MDEKEANQVSVSPTEGDEPKRHGESGEVNHVTIKYSNEDTYTGTLKGRIFFSLFFISNI